MKKFTFFLAVILTAMAAMAQEKVAILETVDKAGDIPYGIKLLLRSSLTTAISNTAGYEGYDRVDMASIASEQEFQRTGNVSDNQIKQIGIASGAKYVLVAEAAKYDDVRIIITAKLLDVETFGVKSSAVQITGTSADEMQRSCEALARQLIRPKREPVVEPQTSKPIALPIKRKVKYRRTTWFGLSVNGGINEFSQYYPNSRGADYKWHNIYCAGLDADLQLPIFNWFSFGPYAGVNIIPNSCRYVAGGMIKITFRNNFGLMLGGGAVMRGSHISGQVRGGIKFRPPVFMTWSYMIGENNYREDGYDQGVTIGIGFSLGGKLKEVE